MYPEELLHYRLSSGIGSILHTKAHRSQKVLSKIACHFLVCLSYSMKWGMLAFNISSCYQGLYFSGFIERPLETEKSSQKHSFYSVSLDSILSTLPRF
jgi:hypothetical protein